MKQGRTEKVVFAKLSTEKVELRAQIVKDVIDSSSFNALINLGLLRPPGKESMNTWPNS